MGVFKSIFSMGREPVDDTDGEESLERTILREEQQEALQQDISEQEQRLAELEESAIWSPDSDPLSWLTQQLDDAKLKIIGVERLPEEVISEYKRIPIKVTVRGDYHALSRFVNKLERSNKALKIESFRMRRKEQASGQSEINLSLSYYQKVENP